MTTRPGKQSDSWKAVVEQATVVMTNLGGRGVLVPGGFVLTAAHCIEWNGEKLFLGDHFIEPIRTAQGGALHLTPVAVDPVSDIAVLGSLDGQEFYDESEAFDTWRAATTPVHLAARLPRLKVSPGATGTFPVHVLTHDRGWIKGTLGRYGLPGPPVCGQLGLHAEGAINSGTSGSPVVDANGLLLGVVSQSGGRLGEPATYGPMPIAWWALPRWVLLAIEAQSPAKQAVLRRAIRRFSDRAIAASPALNSLKKRKGK